MIVLGVSGVAGSGKDTFYSTIREYYKGVKTVQRFALADELKKDLNHFIRERFGFSTFDCNAEQKNLIRPLLVEYGKIKRKQTEGKYWTNLLTPLVTSSNCDIVIITDIRYSEYPEDEIFWLKNVLGGKLIHITRILQEGVEQPPPNEDERKNDPYMYLYADFRVILKHCSNTNDFLKCYLSIVSFINKSL